MNILLNFAQRKDTLLSLAWRNQDALTSNAVIRDSLARFKFTNSNLMRAYVLSDNAGCFHSVDAIFSIPSINQFSELKVTQVDFADPQGGKSICDRRAAHIKGAIGRCVNDGNNVSTFKRIFECHH